MDQFEAGEYKLKYTTLCGQYLNSLTKFQKHIYFTVCAFHLKYDEMRLDKNVEGWAVSVIQLSRTKRHLDRAALMVFWERLDK